MAIHLKNIDKVDNTESNVHWMPCKIHSGGPINLSNYFKPYENEDEKCLSASFRGYPLKGKELEVPEGYKGVIFTETRKPISEEAERNFQATSMFTKLTYWNWDKIPSKADPFISALDWIDISEAVHKDIPED